MDLDLDDDDDEATYSDLGGELEVDGVPLAVAIYRRSDAFLWTLEVINEFGTSSVAETRFLSDAEAWAAFEAILDAEGPGVFFTPEERRRALH